LDMLTTLQRRPYVRSTDRVSLLAVMFVPVQNASNCVTRLQQVNRKASIISWL